MDPIPSPGIVTILYKTSPTLQRLKVNSSPIPKDEPILKGTTEPKSGSIPAKL